jgi:hypothetical protein
VISLKNKKKEVNSILMKEFRLFLPIFISSKSFKVAILKEKKNNNVLLKNAEFNPQKPFSHFSS